MAVESGKPATPSVELLHFHPFGKAPAGAGSGAALGALPNRALILMTVGMNYWILKQCVRMSRHCIGGEHLPLNVCFAC